MRVKLPDDTIWRPYFAILPVRVDGHLVWLETIERRSVTDISNAQWEYRFLSYGRRSA